MIARTERQPKPKPFVLDRERVDRLTGELMSSIVINFQRGPSANQRVYEALNALAVAAATVLAGTVGADDQIVSPEALNFFNQALADNLIQLKGGR
jgi:hypothetical protein